MREKHTDIEVDTCHGALRLWRPPAETIAILHDFDCLFIDEIPQLSASDFERIEEMWLATGKSTAVIVTGDFWQLPPPDRNAKRVWQSPRWSHVRVVKLLRQWRCIDPVLTEKLDALRSSRLMGAEGDRMLQKLCRNHKAWSGHHEPTSLDIADLFRRTNDGTVVVTCTRRAAAKVNALAMQVLFTNKNKPLLCTLPGDYEANPLNYDEHSNLRTDRAPLPNPTPVYIGMRLVITQNRDKVNHCVNGMVCSVERFCHTSGCLQVLTTTHRRLALYPITDDHAPGGRVVCYPVRIGYASTIHKYQGAQLQHVTLWLDRPGCASIDHGAWDMLTNLFAALFSFQFAQFS
jgi:hypothetical protein